MHATMIAKITSQRLRCGRIARAERRGIDSRCLLCRRRRGANPVERQCAELGARLLDRLPRREAAAPTVMLWIEGLLLRIKSVGATGIGEFRARLGFEPRRRHADDREGLVAELHRASDDRRVRAEARDPEIVAEYRDVLGTYMVVGGGERTPDHQRGFAPVEQVFVDTTSARTGTGSPCTSIVLMPAPYAATTSSVRNESVWIAS